MESLYTVINSFSWGRNEVIVLQDEYGIDVDDDDQASAAKRPKLDIESCGVEQKLKDGSILSNCINAHSLRCIV